MKNHWRIILSLLPEALERKFYQKFFLNEHKQWEKNGKPLPVSNYSKQQALKELQEKYDLKILVETGTYLGDTLYSLSKSFDLLYSIELSKHFYTLAKKRFKKIANVKLLQGDSGLVLKELVPKLNQRTLFWLDGHYSGGLTAKGLKECPIFEELTAIFSSSIQHVIAVDDARLFIGKNDYPSLEEMKAFVDLNKPGYNFTIQNDAIVLTPN